MSHNYFINNKYSDRYYSIIDARLSNEPTGYSEKHHILPKCLGGTNDFSNLVALTAREHYICHLLLVKMTAGQVKYKMISAVSAFTMGTAQTCRTLTARQYQTIRELTANLPNAMHRLGVKEKHLDSIAQKIGYSSHAEYLTKVKTEFEKHKTIKGTSEKTGHAQYTIRHLLLDNFGKEWLENIRKVGLIEARALQKERLPFRRKVVSNGQLNSNAYVWKAISANNEIHIIFGDRLSFCDRHGISHNLDINKPHLRKGWNFEKICKVKDY